MRSVSSGNFRHEALREPSAGILPVLVLSGGSFSAAALVTQWLLCHLHCLVSVQPMGDLH
jgi:hypothetical protein